MDAMGSGRVSDYSQDETTVVDKATSDNTPEGSAGPLPDVFYKLIAFYLTLACAMSLVGNIVLTLSMVQTGAWRRPCVNLYIFTINLASLVETVFCFPLVIASTFNNSWLFGDLGCQYYAFLTYTCVLIVMTCYLLVSVHRYRVVVLQTPTENAETRRWVAGSVVAACTYALCWSVCPFLGWGAFVLEPFQTSCSLDWLTPDVSGKMYNVMVFVFLLFIPVGAMAWLSVMVMKKLNMQVSNGNIAASTTDHNVTVPTNNTANNVSASIQARSLKIMVSTLVMFVLFWAPYGILSTMANFGVSIHVAVATVPTIMAKSHCAVNPMVYFICYRHYRVSARELFGIHDERVA